MNYINTLKKLRKKVLKSIIKKILNKEFNYTVYNPYELYETHWPERHEYLRPNEKQ